MTSVRAVVTRASAVQICYFLPLTTVVFFLTLTCLLQDIKKAGTHLGEPALMANRGTLSHPIIEKTTDEIPTCCIPRHSQAPTTRYLGRYREQRKPGEQTSYRQQRHASA